MKQLSLTLTLVLLPIMMWARGVDQEEALQIAERFFAQRSTTTESSSAQVVRRAAKTDEMRVAYTSLRDNGEAALYVINYGGDGFVLVSGDDNTSYPVLGWSDNGSFDYESAPIQLKDMLEAYSHSNSQRKSAAEASAQGLMEMADGSFAKLVTDGERQTLITVPSMPSHQRRALLRKVESEPNVVVSPLLKVQWNQIGDYAKYIDPYFDGYAGCTPTAMAQVMAYWKYPARGRGFHLHNIIDAPDDINVEQLVLDYAYGQREGLLDFIHQYSHPCTANFGESVYQWNAMGGSKPTTDTEYDNVAKLIYDCHISCSPSKLPDGRGTGASPEDATKSLVRYFGYDPDIQQIVCEGNEDLMRQELDAGRPILMVGEPRPGYSNDGHAFVCDGYAEDGYFHLNFGWSGYLDGYYLLTNLTPGSNDFSLHQTAYLGIQPSLLAVEVGQAFINVTPEGMGVVVGGHGDVVVPEKVESYPVMKVNPHAFNVPNSAYDSFQEEFNKEELTRITLPESVTEIGENAFPSTLLTEVNLPNSIRKIGANAFFYSSYLEKVTIPSIESWLNIDFEPNTLESGFDQYLSNPIWSSDSPHKTRLYIGEQEVTDLVIPGSVKEVKPSVFMGYQFLNSVTMEEGVEKIGASAFENVPLKQIKIASTVKEIGKKAFYNHEVSTITIPANLMRIGKDALFGEKIEEYIVDEENTKYSSYQGILYDRARRTLIHCPNLLPGFTESTKRMAVGVPPTVVFIREQAFGDNLERLTLPASVSSLADRAFENTAKLKDLYLYRSQPLTITENTFHSNATSMWYKVNVHVPAGAAEAYKAAPIWKDMNIVEDERVSDGGTPPEHYDYATDNNAIWIMGWMPDETGNYTTREFYILFDTQPVITHQGKSVLITTNNSRYVFEEEVISDNYFAMRFAHYEAPTDIEEVKTEENRVVIRTIGNQLVIKGLDAHTQVMLYSIDGRSLDSAKASANGEVSIPIPDSDLIVVKAGNHSFKIHTKK